MTTSLLELLVAAKNSYSAIAGFEISDVLAINDKDYSITFGLYFSVEWFEPRLNLSREVWGEENIKGEEDLVPGHIFQ